MFGNTENMGQMQSITQFVEGLMPLLPYNQVPIGFHRLEAALWPCRQLAPTLRDPEPIHKTLISNNKRVMSATQPRFVENPVMRLTIRSGKLTR